MSKSSPGRGYRLITLGGLALLDESGRPIVSLGPRNLVLLAYLALATKPVSREHVAELFWGDRDEDRARHSMREALSRIRQLFGPESIPQRSDSVMLDPALPLTVDARALVAASTAGDTRTVVDLYAGAFLEGVHAGGARSFEDWCDAERAMHESRFIAACVRECERLREAHMWTQCAELARRWLVAAPLDPKPALELLRALAAPGTPDALRVATREYRQIAERLAVDFELTPHASVSAAADEIAHRAVALGSEAPSIDAGTAPQVAPVVESTKDVSDAQLETPPQRPARRNRLLAVSASIAIAVLVAAGVMAWRSSRPSGADNGTLAIVPFDVVGSPTDAWLANGLPRLITAALSREQIGVVDQTRLRDLIAVGPAGRAPSSVDAMAAARKLGARWLVTGSISVGGGRYWLDMSLNDLRSGARTRRSLQPDTTLEAVIAQATARLVASVDMTDRGAQFAELDPSTVNAYRAYIRALRLRSQMRVPEATAALDEAIAADSGFVAAVMERRYMLPWPRSPAAVDSARALDAVYSKYRTRATDFERLYFEAYLALHTGDHARAEALGRALLERYPRDPRTYSRAIEILSLHGEFREAEEIAIRAIALDSAGRTPKSDECRVCLGYRVLSEIARVTGDYDRSESAARHATEYGPNDPAAWAQLGAVLSAQGQYDDAIAAARRASTLAPTDPEFAMDPIRRFLEAREYAAADSTLRSWSATNDPEAASDAVVLRALALRERGQFGSATRVLNDGLKRFPADSGTMLLLEGDTRAHAGDVTGARRAFISAVPPEIVARVKDRYPADWPRTFSWPRTLLADALWRANPRDTLRLAALADSIQAVGARSYYARDWRLYHHVRGLIAMSGRRWAEAESELSRARWGRAGWTRTDVELAHAQAEQGHFAASVATLRDAYSAQLAAMGQYVPRSELDLEMARAFGNAGMTDSARVYARHVTIAWRDADPVVQKRLGALPANVTRDAPLRK